jgi:hypothetical protein
MALNKRLIAVETALVVISLLALTFAMSNIVTLFNHGTIKTVGLEAYQDANCTVPLVEIPWGTLTPGQSASFAGYLLNTGNANATLKMNITNWNPANASDFMTLTCDSENATLAVRTPLQATFYLQVSDQISGITDFSFDIFLIAEA